MCLSLTTFPSPASGGYYSSSLFSKAWTKNDSESNSPTNILQSPHYQEINPSEKIDNIWSNLTNDDLRAIYQLIKKHHPAFVDNEQTHNQFKNWFEQGYNQALQLASDVSSFEGYRDSLAFYISGFRDCHLSIHTTPSTPFVKWPEFLLTYRNEKFFITSEFSESYSKKSPPHGAEVIAINHQSPFNFMKSNLYPYINDDPSIASSWTRAAPLLLIERNCPWAEKIETITYRFNEKEIEYKPDWIEIQREQISRYVEKAAYGPAPDFSIHEFADQSIWISLPTFNSHKKDAKAALEKIINCLPTLRTKKRIVFDLRGNSGGDSTWVVKILAAFYGKEYLSSIPHIKNENALADDRLTLEMLQNLQQQIMQEDNLENQQELLLYYEKVKAAYEKGDTFIQRSTDVHFFSEIKQTDLAAANPVSAQVYLLTDGRCCSSGLVFADSILSIPNVIHIGETTYADTQFSQPLTISLPSGKSHLLVPTMIRRNWERKNNEPYSPLHKFHGYMGDQMQLENWVLTLNNTN